MREAFGDLFDSPFNLIGETWNADLTAEGEARIKYQAESKARRDQLKFDMSACGKTPDTRYGYKTAWTLVGGHSFTSGECVAVRYIGSNQYRINESPETLHACHLRDFVF